MPRIIPSPEIEKKKREYEFYRLSYDGGDAYKEGRDANGWEILIPSRRELFRRAHGDYSDYLRRRTHAVYRNHFRSIIDRIAGHVLSKPVTRDERIDDRHAIEAALRRAVRCSLALGSFWVGADAGEFDETIATRADAANRPPAYAVTLDPRNVIDADYAGGELTRIVYVENARRKDSLFARAEEHTYYWEWTADEWRVYVEVAPGNIAEHPVRNGRHGFGRVPWIELKTPFPTGDLAHACRHLFNLQSLLDEELWKNTFTSYLFSGIDPDSVLNRDEASGEMQGARDVAEAIFAPEGASVQPVASNASMANVLIEAIDRDIRELYRIAGLDARIPSLAASGEAKRYDFQQVEAMLIGVAQEAEAAENAVIEMIDPEFSASRWPQRFDVKSFEEELGEYLQLVGEEAIPESYKRHLTRALIRKQNPNTDVSRFVNDVKEK